jgi:hypothetical protein
LDGEQPEALFFSLCRYSQFLNGEQRKEFARHLTGKFPEANLFRSNVDQIRNDGSRFVEADSKKT